MRAQRGTSQVVSRFRARIGKSKTGVRTAFRIAAGELRASAGSPKGKLAIAALLLLPLLYASAQLLLTHDPDDRLDSLPAALVDDDHAGGLGAQLAGTLGANGGFAWEATSANKAENGLGNGDYAFTVTIPEGFTEGLTPGAGAPAPLTLTVGEDGGYLSTAIASQVTDQVRAAISDVAGEGAANRVHVDLSTVAGSPQRAAQLAESARELGEGERALATVSGRLATGGTGLATGLTTLRAGTEQLPSQTARLATGAEQVATGATTAAAVGNQLVSGSATLRETLDNAHGELTQRLRAGGLSEAEVAYAAEVFGTLRTPIDAATNQARQAAADLRMLADGSHRVATATRQLATATSTLTTGIADASDHANELAGTAARLHEGVVTSADNTSRVAADADALHTSSGGGHERGDATGAGQPAVGSAGTPGGPQTTERTVLAPVLLVLATWIGAMTLFLLLRPLSARALAAGVASWRVSLGGWLPAAALGTAQVLVLFAVVTWLAGLDAGIPVATGLLVLIALTFTAIGHALASLFGRMGILVMGVLLAVQFVSVSAALPWRGVPDALIPLHAVLPMGHAVEGLQQVLLRGGSSIVPHIAVLCAYLATAAAVSCLAASHRRMWTLDRLRSAPSPAR
ncbi:YhgE/Pip family protein [Saccharomonospora sp. NPDC006951]